MIALDEIRARTDGTTIGPWEIQGHEIVRESDGLPFFQSRWIADIDPDQRENAEFIAHARTDIPKLLAALDTVLEVHVEVTAQRFTPQQECEACGYAWPCRTVEALTEALA